MALTDEELYLLEDRAKYARGLLQWRDIITEMYGRVSMLHFETGMLKQTRLFTQLDDRVFSSKLIDEADGINKKIEEAEDALAKASRILDELSNMDFTNIEHEAAKVLADCYKKMDESNE